MKLDIKLDGAVIVMLTALFTALKLTGVIGWPWVWVLCPLWISAAILIAFITIGMLLVFIAATFSRFS